MKKFALNLCAGVSLVLLQACDNYTSRPLCNNENATTIPGIEGTYTVSIQGPGYDISTTEVKIESDPENLSHLKFKGFDKDKSLVNSTDAALCHINGRNILQVPEESGIGYSYSALLHSAESLTYQPVAFDRVTLDLLGISWKVVQVPTSDRLALGGQKLIKTDNGHDGLLVDNDGIPLQEVWKTARIMPVGFSLLKK